MKFEAYNYQCSPAEWDGGLFTEDAKKYRNEALLAMEQHLAITDKLFTEQEVKYPQSAEMPLPFKEGDTFRFLRLNTRKRKDVKPTDDKELTRPYLIAKMLYAHSGFYVMTLQNVTMTTLEIDWQRTSLINMPSCIVILANTEGRQLLLVESNKAFSKTKSVAKIFQDTLQALLVPHKLNITFKAHYNPVKFLEHVADKMKVGVGLKSVKFHFDYPNMADDVKLLAGYFKEFGQDMNAEMEYVLKGHHGQPLNIDPQAPSSHLESIIEYSGKTGNKMIASFMDKSKQEYDADHVGISSLVTDEAIKNYIAEMVQNTLVDKNPMLMPLNEDNGAFRDKLAVWFRGLSGGAEEKLS